MRIANVVLNDFTRDNRVLKLSESLASAGHQVTVVALQKSPEAAGPALPERENRDGGWQVIRTRVRSARLPRGTAFGAIKMAELGMRLVWRWRGMDAWHCNDIEAFVLGWLAQRLNPRLQLIYDCHEFEAERNAKPSIERKMVAWLERRMIRKAHSVVTVSPSIVRAYQTRYAEHGIPQVLLVRNVPAPRSHVLSDVSKPNLFKQRFNIPEDDFVALYQGAFSFNRGLETAIDAMEGLADQGIHLVLMGYGPLQHLVDEAAARHPHIHVHPAVAYEEVLAHTLSADIGLVSVKPTCLSYLYCLPNKLFEYILAGVPVLSNDLPDCCDLIASYKVGSIVEADHASGWRKALLEAKSNGTSQFEPGLKRAAETLSWSREVASLLAVYSAMEEGRH